MKTIRIAGGRVDGIKYPRLSDDELWSWCSDPADSGVKLDVGQHDSRSRRQRVYDKALSDFTNNRDTVTEHTFCRKGRILTHIRGGLEKAALGIIKTFGTVFLPPAHMRRVLV